jgi:hypothetical protein
MYSVQEHTACEATAAVAAAWYGAGLDDLLWMFVMATRATPLSAPASTWRRPRPRRSARTTLTSLQISASFVELARKRLREKWQ